MNSTKLPSNIIITHQINDALNNVLSKKNYSQVVVLVDSNTKIYCYPKLNSALPKHEVIAIEEGEQHKNLETCAHVWQALTDLKVDRKGLLIVLGGGVAGDLGGFCAATYKRGIDFVLIPTTLLSQVDASVGGKLGIDFKQFKNHIGVFQEPVATVIDTQFLETLPKEELRSGFAEVIKHCLISDKVMWDVIRSKSLEHQDWDALVQHSIAFKSSVTQQDPKESGLRKILNYGHTIGHAIESYFLKTPHRLLHGEAIAIGMIAESWIAMKKGLIKESELKEIEQYILNIYRKVELPKDTTPIIELTYQDKKNAANKILIAVPNGIGKHAWDVEVSEMEMKESLNYLS